MFTGRSTAADYSMLDCPPLSMPLVIDSATAKWKCTNVEIAPNCPRCASANTKFCYYNNYSLSQPRYFCKACRRYWTKGGSLRNVPVGGGCRKSRRARAAAKPPNCAGPAPAPGPAAGDTNAAACIDLAAVFAKYVNQSGAAEESFSPGGAAASSESSDNNNNINNYNCSYNNYENGAAEAQADLMGGGDYDRRMLAQEMMDGQDYVYQDLSGFDQLQRDVMWSSEGATDFDGAHHVQPMMQVQDFGLISPDDQFRISANLAADNNWGAFDLSAYEFFSNP